MRALICSVTFMEAISAAMAELMRPATMSPVSTGPSSRVSVSATILGTAASAENRANPVWPCRARTMPAKKAVSPTTGREKNPISTACCKMIRG